ncbi:MAG: NADH-quinone oxidoreductase subunit J [Bacteroidales bacterium]|nr:NADH-quinone oxidoreductase subunit J [Muribaculaceae bacterium]MCI6856109.1 NADH-quinone oxidoreductase subunit J [Bacteroidales bacterium]MDY4941834.1 NADH-quinone oxidoreductase subunit J [Candidatus Limisoma sp.]MDD7604539.1 NADH-quinone oxidoreductase subunit J [Bacteroidales bacterium]MDD7759498.1 NADH-quinone oxidoreductase subunit J [Bacteroidales bacterium]
MNVVSNFIVYGIIVLAIVVFSILSVTSRKILRAATYLLFALISTAALYFSLGYEFLGAVQLAVYAGGILVLFVFSILLTSKPGSNAEPLVSKKRWLGITAAVASVAVSVYALVAFFADKAANIMPLRVDMNAIGHALLGTEKFEYLLPFEAVSVLLLACIIGGIVIARKR